MERVKVTPYTTKLVLDISNSTTMDCKWPENQKIVESILVRLVYNGLMPSKYKRHGLPFKIELESEDVWMVYNMSGLPCYRFDRVNEDVNPNSGVNKQVNVNSGEYKYFICYLVDGKLDNTVIYSYCIIKDITDIKEIENRIAEDIFATSVKIVNITLLGRDV